MHATSWPISIDCQVVHLSPYDDVHLDVQLDTIYELAYALQSYDDD